MNILVTGTYDVGYNRTMLLLKGLRQQKDVIVTEYPLKSLRNLSKNDFKEIASGIDYIYFPPFTHQSVKKIKKFLPDKPVIFDPLISKYLTKITDYQQVSKYSPRALKNYLKDKIPLRVSDIVIADTEENKKYYASKFHIDPQKIFVLPIGVDTSIFFPEQVKEKSAYFRVGFYGGFIPLQGVRKIVDTAYVLRNQEDIKFHLAGSGFESGMIGEYVKELKLNNIEFTGWMDYQKLPALINSYDICLGIFGDTPKTNMVIPNKIFHYAAIKKCIITKDTPAIHEIFEDRKNIMLTSNHPEEIADTILEVKKNQELRNNIANNAFQLITGKFSHIHIAEKLTDYLSECLVKK